MSTRYPDLFGSSPAMQELFDWLDRLCPLDSTVLICGESGTGKELVARAIHFHSPRREQPFCAINCGAISEELMESELFGHERGAFTDAIEQKQGQFELASAGTIFLDEIGEIKPEMQVKLLRVLQERTFLPVGGTKERRTEARVVAASNRNLEQRIKTGEFREDLFYRLNVTPLHLPALRERIEDIPELVAHFIRKHGQTKTQKKRRLSAGAMRCLQNHSWPGNVRELEHVIERALIIESAPLIQESDLPDSVRKVSLPDVDLRYTGALHYPQFWESMQRAFFVQALDTYDGNINKISRLCKISKSTLLRKLKGLGLRK